METTEQLLKNISPDEDYIRVLTLVDIIMEIGKVIKEENFTTLKEKRLVAKILGIINSKLD
jgi:hypothetical protein